MYPFGRLHMKPGSGLLSLLKPSLQTCYGMLPLYKVPVAVGRYFLKCGMECASGSHWVAMRN